jgi:hypothetical protein
MKKNVNGNMMEAASYKIKTAKLYILINNITFNIIRIKI